MSSQENFKNNVEQNGNEQEKKKREAIKHLVKNSVQIGNDVKQNGPLKGLQFGHEYSNNAYALHGGWCNFKYDNRMYAVYTTPDVTKKLEEAGFKKEDRGVVGNEPESFYAGVESTSFKAMVKQVGVAREQEKNLDGKFMTDEAYFSKYGKHKP